MMRRRCFKVWHVAGFIAVLAAAIAVVMLLWNAIIPSVIGWQPICYWQAGGLLVLCKLLFGRFGHHRHGFHHGHRKEFAHLHEEMKGMSRDERRSYIRNRMANFGCQCNDKQTTENSSEKQ